MSHEYTSIIFSASALILSTRVCGEITLALLPLVSNQRIKPSLTADLVFIENV